MIKRTKGRVGEARSFFVCVPGLWAFGRIAENFDKILNFLRKAVGLRGFILRKSPRARSNLNLSSRSRYKRRKFRKKFSVFSRTYLFPHLPAYPFLPHLSTTRPTPPFLALQHPPRILSQNPKLNSKNRRKYNFTCNSEKLGVCYE